MEYLSASALAKLIDIKAATFWSANDVLKDKLTGLKQCISSYNLHVLRSSLKFTIPSLSSHPVSTLVLLSLQLNILNCLSFVPLSLTYFR